MAFTTSTFEFKHVIMLMCLCLLVVLPSIHASKRQFTTCSDGYTSLYTRRINVMVEEVLKEIAPTADDILYKNLTKSVWQNIYSYEEKTAEEIETERKKRMENIKTLEALNKKLAERRAKIEADVIAKNPEQNSAGRIRFSEVDVSPETLIPDSNATVILKAVRGESIPNDSVAVDMTLIWESLVATNRSRSEYLLCGHTDKPCPIASNDPFSATILLPIPRDVFPKFKAELRIVPRNISNGFILGCVRLEVKVHWLPKSS